MWEGVWHHDIIQVVHIPNPRGWVRFSALCPLRGSKWQTNTLLSLIMKGITKSVTTIPLTFPRGSFLTKPIQPSIPGSHYQSISGWKSSVETYLPVWNNQFLLCIGKLLSRATESWKLTPTEGRWAFGNTGRWSNMTGNGMDFEFPILPFPERLKTWF